MTLTELCKLVWISAYSDFSHKQRKIYSCRNDNNTIAYTSKKQSPYLYEGSQFQIWLLYGDIIDTNVCAIFSSTFWYLIFLHVDHKLTTFNTDLCMTNDAVWKVANCKDHVKGNYTNRLHYTCPFSDHIDHCTTVPCPLKLAQFSPLLITAQCLSIQRGLFNCGVHSNVAL